MKKGILSISVFLALALLCAGCSSTTLIQSNPGKAKVFVFGKYVGETPYLQRDSRIEGSSILVMLEKEGYEHYVTTITKDEKVNVGAVVGGLFTIVPLLWSMQYGSVHTYELQPTIITKEVEPVIHKIQKNTWPKADKLREFKKLRDEQVITPDEFEKEKKKVLEEKDKE